MAGLYGKLPIRGDFLTRRLSQTFVQRWDDWLQTGMEESRRRLEDEWLDCYLVAPLWRFAMLPGTVDGRGYAGVLVPSVDRVGRYFPLTLADELPALPAAADVFVAMRGWFDALEDLALKALAPNLDFEPFDAELAALAPPTLDVVTDVASPVTPIAMATGEPCIALSAPSGLSDTSSLQTWKSILGAMPPTAGIWESGHSDWWGQMYLACPGFPAPACFAALLDGLWELHGWQLRIPDGLS